MDRTQRSAINALVSMIGYVVPMALGLISAPILLSLLGEEAFGLQSLVSVVIGYAAMMDAGLAFPVTKFLVEDQAAGATDSQNRQISTTLYRYPLICLIGMVVLLYTGEWMCTAGVAVPRAPEREHCGTRCGAPRAPPYPSRRRWPLERTTDAGSGPA